MGITTSNRINKITVEEPSTGLVDVSRIAGTGRFARGRSRLGAPIVFTGIINFQQKNYDIPAIDLDWRVNKLWCKGSIVRIYALRDWGTEELLRTFAIKKVQTQLEDSEGIVRAIVVELTEFMGEENAKGRDVITVGASGSARRILAQSALQLGTNRTLTYDLDAIGLDAINGTIPLLKNQSAAGLAAQLGAANLAWIFHDQNGNISSIARKLSNEDRGDPVYRKAFKEFVRNEPQNQIEDIADEICASSQLTVLRPPALPFQSESTVYSRASDIFPNPDIGNNLVFKKVVTTIDQAGLQVREVTEPLAGFLRLGDTSGYDPSFKTTLLSYHTYTETDSFKQYDAQGKLVRRTFERQGPVTVFQENYNPSLEDIFGDADNPSDFASILTPVTLRREERIQYLRGLPLFQDGTEEYITNNWLNGGVGPEDGFTIGQTPFEEKWSEATQGQYWLERLSGNPAVGRETSLEGPTGPPQPEFRESGTTFEQVLIEASYTTDTSDLNCGPAKPVCINVPYGKTELLPRVAQWELERRIAQSRSRAFTTGLPDFMFDWVPFQLIHVGDRAYEVDAELVEWDNNLNLFCRFEGHEVGTLDAAVPPTLPPRPPWPPKLTPSFEPIVGDGCPTPTVPSTPPTTLTIGPIDDLTVAIGETVFIPLSAINGVLPYEFLDGGGLPGWATIETSSDSTAAITGIPDVTSSGNVDIQVEDDNSDIDSTTFVLTVIQAPKPVFPVPALSIHQFTVGATFDHVDYPYELTRPLSEHEYAVGVAFDHVSLMAPTSLEFAVGIAFDHDSQSTSVLWEFGVGITFDRTSDGAGVNSLTFLNGSNWTFFDGTDFEEFT